MKCLSLLFKRSLKIEIDPVNTIRLQKQSRYEYILEVNRRKKRVEEREDKIFRTAFEFVVLPRLAARHRRQNLAR